MDFDSPREAMKSPLAVKLFSIEGVKGREDAAAFSYLVLRRRGTINRGYEMEPDAPVVDAFRCLLWL
jgi:hypothetical protein